MVFLLKVALWCIFFAIFMLCSLSFMEVGAIDKYKEAITGELTGVVKSKVSWTFMHSMTPEIKKISKSVIFTGSLSQYVSIRHSFFYVGLEHLWRISSTYYFLFNKSWSLKTVKHSLYVCEGRVLCCSRFSAIGQQSNISRIYRERPKIELV